MYNMCVYKNIDLSAMLSDKCFGHGGTVGLKVLRTLFCVNSFGGRGWVRNKKAETKRGLWMPMSIKEPIKCCSTSTSHPVFAGCQHLFGRLPFARLWSNKTWQTGAFASFGCLVNGKRGRCQSQAGGARCPMTQWLKELAGSKVEECCQLHQRSPQKTPGFWPS